MCNIPLCSPILLDIHAVDFLVTGWGNKSGARKKYISTSIVKRSRQQSRLRPSQIIKICHNLSNDNAHLQSWPSKISLICDPISGSSLNLKTSCPGQQPVSSIQHIHHHHDAPKNQHLASHPLPTLAPSSSNNQMPSDHPLTQPESARANHE